MFTAKRFGPVVVPNRFMRSATWEALADAVGNPTQKLIDLTEDLAKGGVGLIVPGAMYVTPKSSAVPRQSGMCLGEHSRAWRGVVDKVHSHGSKIMFQVVATCRFRNPKWNGGFEPLPVTSLEKGEKEMTNADIEEMIQQFIDSAYLVARSGADGIQLHGAHVSSLAEFLSPRYNQRTDKWGGSPEKRVRVVKEIAEGIRKRHPGLMLSIKLNGADYIDGGVTPAIASKHVNLLSGYFDLVEVSCGMSIRDFMWSVVDDEVLVRGVKRSERENLVKAAHTMYDGQQYQEMYNLEIVKLIHKENPEVPLALVGGCRDLKSMEAVIKSGCADMISLSRPFIRDPYLVNRFRSGEACRVSCTSCGTCLISCEKGVYCHKP